METVFKATLVQDGEDLFLPLPPALVAKLGWKEGDELEVSASGDTALTFRKVSAPHD